MTLPEREGLAARASRKLQTNARMLFGPPVHAAPPSERRRLLWLALIALPVIVLVILLADERVLAWARTLPPIFARIGYVGSQLGFVEVFYWPLGALLILLPVLWLFRLSPMSEAQMDYVYARVTFLFAVICLPVLVTSALKILIGRLRPYDPATTGAFDFAPIFLGKIHSGGMPSTHATVVVAAAVAIGALGPRSRPAIWAFAAFVIVSRILVRDHYPSDVLLGALVGFAAASTTRSYFADRNIAVTRNGQNRIIAVPNPALPQHF
jgi:membrane-associated phospholipid phosphatase